MATWTISDNVDAQLRERLGSGEDVSRFVERFFADQLAYDNDAQYRERVNAQLERSAAELDAGQGIDALASLRMIADEFGISMD